MKHFFSFTLIVFSLFSFPSIAQENVISIKSGDITRFALPDISGNILTKNQSTGQVEVIPVDKFSHNFYDNLISSNGSESAADMLMYPGFPVTINTIGYNVGMEGPIYCNMDADPEMEIVINLGQTIQAFNMDGTPVPGWPKTISQVPSGGPVFGDIDGDGEGEVVIGSYFGSSAGYVYAYKKDGSTVPGFPVNTGYIWMSPTLADLNNDGKLEIIVGKRQYPTGQVLVIQGDGTPLPGWPQNMAGVPAASAAVGDITGDNSPEVIFQSLNMVYAWSADGTPLTGFPFTLPGSAIFSYSSPVLADINNDGQREIIFGSHEGDGLLRGVVHIIKNDGTVYPGWPKYTTYWVYSPPAIGYINNDNILDVAVGDQVLSGTPANFVYAWDINGNPLTGFPVGPQDAVNSHIVIVDIDNDNMMELIYDNNSSAGGIGKYHALNHDGTVVTGWPLETQGGTFFVTPVITDININNVMDMIGAGSSGTAPTVATFLGLWNAQVPYSEPRIEMPMYQYNQHRSGVYENPSIVPVEMVSFTSSVRNNEVSLEWITATETNNSGFQLTRDNQVIAFIEGKGTTTSRQQYSYTDKDLASGIYTYRLNQIDYDGSVNHAGALTVELNIMPELFSLEQNYPNPFNPVTVIRFNIPDGITGEATLKIFDMLGNEIAVLVNETKPAGIYQVEFDASSLPSGMYLYSLRVNEFTAVKKMIYLK